MEVNSLDEILPLSSPDGNNLFAPSLIEDENAEHEGLDKMCLLKCNDETLTLVKDDILADLEQSQGETIFEVGTGEGDRSGLSEKDLEISIKNLEKIAEALNAECVELRRRKAKDGLVADYLIRKTIDPDDFMELRVAVVGNVDAGKSTLLGVLTHGELDNGRGMARQRLFRHKHEIESGRTSSVGNDILGFDARGNIVNKLEHGNIDWVRICEDSAKVITFIDLAGHEKYLKTTVFGMTGHAPDYAMLMIGANAGVIGMALEHLKLVLALNVPVFVVITKIDMCPENVLDVTIKYLLKLLKSSGCRKIPILVQSHDDAVCCALNFTSERTCPIFQVSNVLGTNLDLLKCFLNLLATPIKYDSTDPAEFQIDDTFQVPGVGTVVSGTLLQGHIRLNDILFLGPDKLGQFQAISVKSIHRKRMPVKEVRGGQTASFSLKKIKRSAIRKGMVMVSNKLDPKACLEFEADIRVLHHPTTISVRYQAMVHVGSVRQTATIIWMSEDHLRTKSRAFVRFRFIKNPEYLRLDMKLVFREGRTKAVGHVTKLYPYVPVSVQNVRHHRGIGKKLHEASHSAHKQSEGKKSAPKTQNDCAPSISDQGDKPSPTHKQKSNIS